MASFDEGGYESKLRDFSLNKFDLLVSKLFSGLLLSTAFL